MSEYTPTTEEVRAGYSTATYDDAKAETEFDRWLIAERQRVAQMATEKERNRVISTLQKTIDDCPDADFCEECDITRHHMSIIMSLVTLGKIK